HFESEEACISHFKTERDKLGVVCRCGHTEHYWIKSRISYECKKCRKRMTLKSGTIMQGSNLSFLTWYKTMFLLSMTKKGFSSKEIQRQLGLKRYEPVWAMVHKLRTAMGNRDARYTLEGMIELDEGYFTVETSEVEKSKGVRGRGAAGKQNVAVMAESTPLEDTTTGKQQRQCRYFKAKVLDTHYKNEINQTVEDSIDERSIVFTDKSTSYVDIADYVELHVTEKSDKQTTKETLKWVHITISNAKRNLLGNYHKIKGKYLQLYLNEFVYKLNRRYF
ncbi:IS1595 family transposase, partial [Snuella lapsa]|uniref:IS1595 family transposase n=1 Tax=Snuella lapsa TaxID=870481 RepID=UPI0031F0800F